MIDTNIGSALIETCVPLARNDTRSGVINGVIKAASIAAKAALAAQVTALFLGVLKIAVALSLDGQHFIVQIQGDIFFEEPGRSHSIT